MGRNRKDGDPLGLVGTRLAFRRGKFWYRHRHTGRWEDVGTDVAQAKRRAALYNDPGNAYGTTAYWLDRFVLNCEARVKAETLSQRTLDDYRTAVGTTDEPSALRAYFGGMLPEQIKPGHVQSYLTANAEAGRPVPANRERACLSSMLSWLLRNTEECPAGMKVNPCMRASGVIRNPESKRERYVTHEEYRAVYAAGNRAVQLAMELVYRTLQRPEVDVLAWTPANVRIKGGEKVLTFRQSKTGRPLDIALVGELGALVRAAIGDVPQLHQPILHRLDGERYTYDGLSAMLKQAQARVRAEHAKSKGPLADMPSFGLRDLKGKGATDMWLSGVPIERIQLLCGHADKATTETYIKARWSETAMPNAVSLL